MQAEIKHHNARRKPAMNAMEKAELNLKAFSELLTRYIDATSDGYIKKTVQITLREGIRLSKSSSLFQLLIRMEHGEVRNRIDQTELMRAIQAALHLLLRFPGKINQPLNHNILSHFYKRKL